MLQVGAFNFIFVVILNYDIGRKHEIRENRVSNFKVGKNEL